jgi:hypothetical protein
MSDDELIQVMLFNMVLVIIAALLSTRFLTIIAGLLTAR